MIYLLARTLEPSADAPDIKNCSNPKYGLLQFFGMKECFSASNPLFLEAEHVPGELVEIGGDDAVFTDGVFGNHGLDHVGIFKGVRSLKKP